MITTAVHLVLEISSWMFIRQTHMLCIYYHEYTVYIGLGGCYG